MGDDRQLEPVLIAFVKHNKLQFSANAFKEILSKVGSRPVSIVSVSHPNEEQKNEIFNECLKYLQTFDVRRDAKNGFVWKNKSQTDAKGIYLCPEPIIIKKSGQEVAVLLMETNGTIEEQLATKEDLMLFALNSVLSSTVMYSIPNNLSDNTLEFLQLFSKYAKGGIGSDLNDSYLNLVLLMRDWKSANRYPFGYHDSATCPPNGDKMINYRKERLNLDGGQENAFRNKYFVDSYQKISFCLMPGKDSEATADQNSNIPKFGDIFRQIIGRLFHPSSVSIKRLSHQKFNGNQLVRLFEQISALMAESDESDDFNTRVRDVKALSSGINYYNFKMNKLIEDNKYLDENDLNLLHKDSRDSALKLFESIRGTTVLDQNQNKNSRDRFNEIFEQEVERVYKLYEDLNQMKFETLKQKQRSQRMVDEMVERVVQKKTQFNGQQTALDIEISQLIGFGLDGLTSAVRSTIGTN